MYNILIDLLPNTVAIDGIKYDINSDFRTSILFTQLMKDVDIPENEAGIKVLELYYPILSSRDINDTYYIENLLKNIDEAINKILWFYRCGDEIPTNNKIKDKNISNNKVNIPYDFDFDSKYIYTSFLKDYSIDLQDVQNLHWWKFKAMFDDLSENTKMMQVIKYRTIDTSKIENKEDKNFYENMKKIYKIPTKENKKLEKKQNDIYEQLINGTFKGL